MPKTSMTDVEDDFDSDESTSSKRGSSSTPTKKRRGLSGLFTKKKKKKKAKDDGTLTDYDSESETESLSSKKKESSSSKKKKKEKDLKKKEKEDNKREKERKKKLKKESSSLSLDLPETEGAKKRSSSILRRKKKKKKENSDEESVTDYSDSEIGDEGKQNHFSFFLLAAPAAALANQPTNQPLVDKTPKWAVTTATTSRSGRPRGAATEEADRARSLRIAVRIASCVIHSRVFACVRVLPTQKASGAEYGLVLSLQMKEVLVTSLVEEPEDQRSLLEVGSSLFCSSSWHY